MIMWAGRVHKLVQWVSPIVIFEELLVFYSMGGD